MLYVVSNGMAKTAEESYVGVVAAGYAMKYTEVIHQRQQKFFMVIHDLVYFMTCFGQLGYLQLIHTTYELLGRKLST